MSITFSDEKPIFIQVAEFLEDAILREVYKEEDQVPSITEFSVAYKINPATALKGINLLVEEGLIYKKRGLGMFVTVGAKEKLLNQRKESFYQAYVLKMIEEAKRLEINVNELKKMIERGYGENGD